MGRKVVTLCLVNLLVSFYGYSQIVSQLNAQFNITKVNTITAGAVYQLQGAFTDLSSSFTASKVVVGDQVVDLNGVALRIESINSLSGSVLTVTGSLMNTSTKPPGVGLGIIYHPTEGGYSLITTSTPAQLLAKTLNSTIISINNDLPSFVVCTSLPNIVWSIGSAVVVSSTAYQFTTSGWSAVSPITTKYGATINSVAIGAAGTIIKYFSDGQYYLSDGTTWNLIQTVSALPTVPKSGDIYYVSGENVLYMLVDDGAGNKQWMAISSAGISTGGNGDFPSDPKPGLLYFNTDNNTLYLFDMTNTWVEISTNGSTPGDMNNPDPGMTTIKEGRLFYNTSEHQLYVFNGSIWIPLGNALPDAQIYVGNTSNIATPVSLSGDATITSAGKLTINNAAITDSKLDKANIPLSGFGNAKTNISMGDGTTNYRINNLLNPAANQDAATKGYVDNLLSNPSSSLTLNYNNFFVGNALNKAVPTAKTSIPLSGFGIPTANISMNGKQINNLASPSLGTDAVTKDYVDNKSVYPINIGLNYNMLLLGNAQDQAGMVEKKDISVSDFGAATSDISLGSFKLTAVADPVAAQDASTKNYVDTKIFPSTNIALASGSLLVGNSSGVATATLKNAIPLSGFGAAAADISMGTSRIVSLGAPVADTDASTKKYVDDLFLSPSSILSLPAGSFFVGNSLGKAAPTIKSSIPVSGFGKATETVYMGDPSTQYNISNLAEPMSGKDAATKNYVDTKIANPSSITVATDYILVGNAANQAEAVAKNTIPLNDFGAVNANLSLGNYKITNLADPVSDGDAVNKKYITTQLSNVNTLLSLPEGQLFLGNASGKAIATVKNTIPLSGFAAAAADVALGSFKLTGVADPLADQDAATKKYVDSQLATVNSALLLPQGNMLVGDASGKASSTAKSAITLSGFGDASANVSMGTGSNNYKIINLADPTGDQDAATKKYVDGKTAGVTTGTTPPTNPTAGNTYYNTTDKTLYVYDGSQWVPVDNKLASGQLYVGDAQNKAVSTAKNTIPLSGFAAAAADVALGSFKLTGVADPSADQDAATKKYVDGKTAGVTTGPTPPTNPTAGTTYYNTTDKTLYVYDGSQWVPVDNKLASGQLYVGDAQNKAVATAKNTIPLSGFAAAAADVALGSFKLTGVADPLADQDAATKKYVDGLVAGVTSVFSLAKGNMLVGDDSGKAASTAKSAITLSGFKEAEANISMGSGSNNYKIINLADPTGNQDAATKKYVDNIGAASKDNLGNHTATEALKMGSYSVSNDGDAGDGVAFDTDGHATFGKDVTVNGNFYTPSDERLKTDIETLTNVLEKINNLRGVQFEYKDQKKYAKGLKMGVIAQELLLIYPEMVTKGDDGYLKVDYTQLTAVLIQAVKEQQQQIKQQQQDIDEMKVRLDKQQQQINSILMQLK